MHLVAQSPFDRAVAAQQDGDPAEAVRVYEALLAEGSHAPELYYNLGVAYLELDSLGRAVLNLERARRWRPGSDRIQTALEEARARIPDALPVVPDLFLVRWWRRGVALLPANGWLVLGQLLFWGALGGWFLWRRSLTPRTAGTLWVVVVLGASALVLGFARTRLLGSEAGAGVVVVRTDLHGAPDATSARVRTVPEGTAYAPLEKLGAWRRVELANGETGWVAEAAIRAF